MNLWPFNRPRQEVLSPPEVAKQQRLRLSDGSALGWILGRESSAGKKVNLQTTLQLATAWACIRLTATAVASLPAAVYEKGSDGNRVSRDDHELAELLLSSPNASQTPLEFWETKVGGLVARGNSYSERVFSGSRLTALEPVSARPVRIDGELKFKVHDRGKEETLPADKIWHLKGFNFGGDEGLSPIALGVHSLGSAMAADETAARIFANGLQQPLFINSGQAKLTPEQRNDLRSMFKKFVGSDNAGKVMVLEQGMSPIPFTLNPEDAQMLDSRRFNVEEMCRWYGMPPIIIGHAADGQTMWGTGVEQILIAWLTLGINPLCRRIEARVTKDLVPVGQKRRIQFEFNREGLLQADSQAKAEYLSKMVQNALMTRNEARAKLNLPKVPGGDTLTAQTNLAPLDQLGQGGGDVSAQMRFLLGIKDD
ncbi:phage portal protein [Brevundimonas diminuta]|uniref:phage portal protein n=1 Tax=Brevundimonas diminuta TaxID=293 RepID=UPI0035D916AD